MEFFTSRNGAVITEGQTVAVHWNAHQNCYSIVEMKSANTIGKVLGYADYVTMADVKTKIDKSKKKKSLENMVKDRHTFLVGKILSCGNYDEFAKTRLKQAGYSPRKYDFFFDLDSYLGEDNLIELQHMGAVYLTSHKNQKLEKTFPVTFYNHMGTKTKVHEESA